VSIDSLPDPPRADSASVSVISAFSWALSFSARTCSTRGSVAMSGLKGRMSQARKPQTSSALAGSELPARTGKGGRERRSNSAASVTLAELRRRGSAVLESTCASPWGKTSTSPACSSSGGSACRPPKQVPRLTTWYSIRCCAPGMIVGASSLP